MKDWEKSLCAPKLSLSARDIVLLGCERYVSDRGVSFTCSSRDIVYCISICCAQSCLSVCSYVDHLVLLCHLAESCSDEHSSVDCLFHDLFCSYCSSMSFVMFPFHVTIITVKVLCHYTRKIIITFIESFAYSYWFSLFILVCPFWFSFSAPIVVLFPLC